MPTPLAPAWTSTVSPACSRPNSNRQSCAVPYADRHARGLDRRRRRDQPAVARSAPRAVRRASRTARVTTRSPTLMPVTSRRPRRPCRRTGSRRCGACSPARRPAVEGVAAFDADRLHRTSTPFGPALRVGDLLVPQDVGSAVLVVHRCIHGRCRPGVEVRSASSHLAHEEFSARRDDFRSSSPSYRAWAK